VLSRACATAGDWGWPGGTSLTTAHFDEKQNSTGRVIMLVKITMAIALILGTASGAVAKPKQTHNTGRVSGLYHVQHSGSTSRSKTAHAKRTYAKIVHAKTTQKQKHRTNQAHVAYENRGWSFSSATSALAMVNTNQSGNRHYKLYDTRAQYSAPGSRPAATALPRHSSNPAYDVYSTRGWYIGSDPDATVRFMIAMDPASVD